MAKIWFYLRKLSVLPALENIFPSLYFMKVEIKAYIWNALDRKTTEKQKIIN